MYKKHNDIHETLILHISKSTELLIDIALNDYSLTDNSELLQRRLKALRDSKIQLQENLNQQTAYNRTLERETCRLKSETGQLARQRDRYALYVSCFKHQIFLFIHIGKLSNYLICLHFVSNTDG